MLRPATLTLFVFLPAILHADSASQTDWSGGPGVAGPITAWDSTFLESVGVSWSSPTGQISILPGDFENMVDSTFTSPNTVRADDIDGDGDADVLSGGASLSWWENSNGSGTSWIENQIADVSWAKAITTDIDGDGDADVLISKDYFIAWYENVDGQGTNWWEHVVDTDLNRPVPPCSGDYDNDGDMDILCANWISNDGNFYWWENMNGQGTSWTEHTIATTCSGGFFGVYSDDIDGDGDSDFIGAAIYNSRVLWLENTDGLGTTWVEHTIDDDFDSAVQVYADDLDGDGDLDVLGAGTGADAVTWWENLNGSGSDWSKHIVADYSSFVTARSEDLDRDGDSDIFLTTGLDGQFIWLENINGLGTIWEEHLVCDAGMYNLASDIYAEDLNGDGWQDLLGARDYDNAVTWWNIHVNEALLESSILDLGSNTGWGNLTWTANMPSGTGVAFQVRASDDYNQMGVWSDTLDSPCSLENILSENDYYFQYRTILTTTEQGTSPDLLDISVSWEPLSIGEAMAPGSVELLPLSPNPVSGAVSVTIGMPESGPVTLSIFDVAGRLTVSTGSVNYQPGYSTVQLEGFCPGIYFVRMQAGEFEATRRFIQVE
ncbi:MAG: T9SS type A sorting domain-containing protein [Candidatus Fermentibacteria bacterium]|nr:T9SS type A sorting domain-containing protein [Candidatus Fermentibacteria bacterium]